MASSRRSASDVNILAMLDGLGSRPHAKRNMLWYTLILIPLTVLPVAFGALGIPYLVMALVLGGILLRGVIRVIYTDDFNKPAWSVYKYSLLYLALLFAAMVVDRAIR